MTILNGERLRLLASVVVLVLLGLRTEARQTSEDQDRRAYQLTAQEEEIAIRLADQTVDQRKLRTKGNLYRVNVELVRGKPGGGEGEDKRLARVTYYRYDGDLAILTLVDIKEQSTLRVDTIPHLAVPLSDEEFKIGRDLALADPKVKADLGTQAAEVKVEALMLRTSDPKDPIFGHRVLRLLFRLGDDYLSKPIVLVDLTTKRVTIEKPTPATHRH